MTRFRMSPPLAATTVLVLAAGCRAVRVEPKTAEIPEQVGLWRVTVGPAGNEFYEVPPAIALPPPSAEILNLVDAITGDAEVGEWVGSGGMYRIDATTESGRYRAWVDTSATLQWLVYFDDESETREAPNALVWSGTRRSVALAELPKPASQALRDALPQAAVDSAWLGRGAVGERYVMRVEDWVFYATPDGSIRAGGLISNGAGNEADSARVDDPGVDPEDLRRRMDELLGPYRSRFNVDSMIVRVTSRDPGSGRGFRFVVLGDSRSQYELWFSMVRHIDQLRPKPAFGIITGDIVLRGYVEELRGYYVPPLLDADIPYFVAIGNHDIGDEGQATEYRYLFGDNSLNFHFDYGGYRFVFMDNVSAVQPYDQTLRWLDGTLSQTPPGFRKLVFTHQPPADIEKWAYHAWDLEDSRIFTQTMTKHAVEHVFVGHIHAYSTATKDGVGYTISGGGGAGLHDRYGPEGNVHHYVICDVGPDGQLTQTVVRFYPIDSVGTGDPGEPKQLETLRALGYIQ